MLITAAGSLPGDDFLGALAAMREVLPERTPWPELPARGTASGILGRALGLIDGLSFDLQPAGWRLTSHSDAAHRRALAHWRRDLDDAEELLSSMDARIKIAVAGPWTLAAMVERPRGDKVLADAGARRDLAQALEAGVAALRKTLARRLPMAQVAWQLDEPALVAVRDGRVPTSSGFGKHRRVDEPELAEVLRPWHGATLHCCAPGDWLDIAAHAGLEEAYVDARFAQVDAVGEWVDRGGRVILGIVDTALGRRQPVDDLVDVARGFTRELGVGQWLTLAPACGFARWQASDVTWQLRELRRAGNLLDADRE